MIIRKVAFQAYHLFVLCAFLIFPLSSQGCAMSDVSAAEVQLIHQILLKPIANTPTTEQGELTAEYMDYLRSSLGVTAVPDAGELDDSLVETAPTVTLSYVRPMNGDVHVLKIEPSLLQEAAIVLTDKLSELDDVEYAEPDFPRRRR